MEERKADKRLEAAAEEYTDRHPTCGIAKASFIEGALWMLDNPTGKELLYVSNMSYKIGYERDLEDGYSQCECDNNLNVRDNERK